MLRNKNYTLVLLSSLGVLILIFLWSLSTGRYDLNIISVSKLLISKVFGTNSGIVDKSSAILFKLRLPRALAALFVGAALAMSGASYQGVFKNPLVSPDMLGVSSGAAVGAGIAILLNFNVLGVQVASFLGGIIAVMITSYIPKLLRFSSDLILVLSGIIVSGITTSFMGLIKYMADSETQLPEIVYWQMGSLAKVSIDNLYFLVPVIIIFSSILIMLSWKINILSLGDKEASSLGINTKVFKIIIIISSTFLTASSVCIAGTIGWIGLVIPHFCRILIGPDNSKLLPLSFIFGGSFLLLIDTLSRSISSTELPITILTGLVGAPFYLYLLYKQRMNIK